MRGFRTTERALDALSLKHNGSPIVSKLSEKLLKNLVNPVNFKLSEKLLKD